MSSDTKAELTSELVDYVWHKVLNKTTVHSQLINGDVKYFSDAQELYNNLYDIVDEVVG